jgi:hypothetical protein
MIALVFLSNTATKLFNQYFKRFRCKHFEINNMIQVLSGRVDSDYLSLLLDINYFVRGSSVKRDYLLVMYRIK